MCDNHSKVDIAALKAKASQEVDPVKQYRDKTGPNKEFYDRVVASKESWKLLSKHLQPTHTGVPYFVPAGGVLTLRQTHGPQINDVMFVNAHDLRETASFETTLQLEGFQMTTYRRAWTHVPWVRPIMTIVEDGANYDDKESLQTETTKWHFWGPHCTSELLEAASGVANLPSCQTMFEMAWEKLGVSADDWRTKQVDLNFFQPNDFAATDENGFCVGGLFPGKSMNQYVSLYAEMDCYMLVIQCPFGNQEKPILEAECFPQTVEIYDTGIRPEENPKHFSHSEQWNLRKNQLPADPERPAAAKRIPGVNTLEKIDGSFNEQL